MLFNPNLLKVVMGSDWLEARGPYDNKIVAMCLHTHFCWDVTLELYI
jgi:hypothetical protein